MYFATLSFVMGSNGTIISLGAGLPAGEVFQKLHAGVGLALGVLENRLRDLPGRDGLDGVRQTVDARDQASPAA